MTMKTPTLTWNRKGVHLTVTSSMLIVLLGYIGFDMRAGAAGDNVATTQQVAKVEAKVDKNTNDVQQLKTDSGVVQSDIKHIMQTCNDLKRDSREQRAAISEIKTILIRIEQNGH